MKYIIIAFCYMTNKHLYLTKQAILYDIKRIYRFIKEYYNSNDEDIYLITDIDNDDYITYIKYVANYIEYTNIFTFLEKFNLNNESLFVYLTGHGTVINNKYHLSIPTCYSDIIQVDEDILIKYFYSNNDNIMIIDTCYSGKFLKRVSKTRKFIKGYLMSSCSDTQLSLLYRNTKGSAFTYYFTSFNKRKNISYKNIYKYVRDKLMKKYNQSPCLLN